MPQRCPFFSENHVCPDSPDLTPNVRRFMRNRTDAIRCETNETPCTEQVSRRRTRRLMTFLILLCVGCFEETEETPKSSFSGYTPPKYAASRSTSRISEDIRAIRSETPAVRNRTRLTELADSGIDFTYENGARGQALMVEATGGGCGWLDYDSDGRPDLYLVQGGNPAAPPSLEQPADRLYRNLGGDRFQDVTIWTGITDPQARACRKRPACWKACRRGSRPWARR